MKGAITPLPVQIHTPQYENLKILNSNGLLVQYKHSEDF
jgi:hypothetical protein